MNLYYFLQPGGEPEGPFPETEIERRLKTGALSPSDLVCQIGWEQWEPAEKIFTYACPLAMMAAGNSSDPLRAASPAVPINNRNGGRGIVRRDYHVCLQCQTVIDPAIRIQGSFLIEVILWLFFCLPGLIYTLWRLTSKKSVCPICGSSQFVPVSTLGGRIAIERQGLALESVADYRHRCLRRALIILICAILMVLFLIYLCNR